MASDLKSSYEWARELKIAGICQSIKESVLEILDPDGWDRERLSESYSEKITKKEFAQRIRRCTCKFVPESDLLKELELALLDGKPQEFICFTKL